VFRFLISQFAKAEIKILRTWFPVFLNSYGIYAVGKIGYLVISRGFAIVVSANDHVNPNHQP